ncbi:MAG TPA: hypothetical protein DCL08_04115 [Anaerolineaceae bacterium]|nr:hypothetical protein [Anaerolineaceae bacterium]
MIEKYFRPQSVDEALELLTDSKKGLKPLGGGTSISRQRHDYQGVVDLQETGLDQIKIQGQRIQVGAMVRLNDLVGHPDIHPEIQRAIMIDASENICNIATLGGWLVSSTGRSITSCVLLALDTTLTWEPGNNRVRMGNWLPLRDINPPGILITEAEWWLRPHLAFEYVARSPKDKPILIAAVAQWGSGRTRVVLGGYGVMPIVAMDGPNAMGVDAACRDAYSEAEDEWASGQYRMNVAAKLALRCLDRIDAIKESEV